ncbi:hypothetical protein KGF56_001960 [Candida oxycetoniae]|uniref:Ada DNA repair metal-binding domain-containing protein n=1 Tax=Candida oxycetoniae TaxID=497107 RepID=A0AAI9WYD2_9ASCO|nr:uncharacterized protein KGF56_001960 [Candida oxycetoniae]KAI3405245.2 hypothetical protein KGF56_001960 [Candida oxycetoniae]
MVYRSETSKWKAYQFSDPFAAGSFFVCNKLNRYFCRPDCDARPRTNLKSEIKFVSSVNEACSLGFIPCEVCDPIHSTAIDVNLLIKCVSTVNNKIGFMLPLLDENEELNSRKIKENILESKKANEEQILKTINGSLPDIKSEDGIANGGDVSIHRASVPSFGYQEKVSKDLENTLLSKNDSDHYRLVDLACRHLALAAAVNVFQPKPIATVSTNNANINNNNSNNTTSGVSEENTNATTVDANGTNTGTTPSKKRRRRGGVLGFKELAAKSKLSAWHFHRVFKSVTGLTPKTYGDKCWEFIKKVKESGEYTLFETFNSPTSNNNNSAFSSSSYENAKDSSSPMPTSPTSQNPPMRKKTKLESSSSSSSSSPPNPLTPPNQTTSGSLSQLNTLHTELPDSLNPHSQITFFDDPLQELPTLDLEATHNSNQDGYYLNMKAFSYPCLSKFRGDSLFNDTQPLQYIPASTEFVMDQQEQEQEQKQEQERDSETAYTSQTINWFGDAVSIPPTQPQPTTSSTNFNNNPSTTNTTNTTSLNDFDFTNEQPISSSSSVAVLNNYNGNIGEDLDFIPSTAPSASLALNEELLFTTTTPFAHFNASSYFGGVNGSTQSTTTNPSCSPSAIVNDDIFNDTSFLAMNPQLAASIGL